MNHKRTIDHDRRKLQWLSSFLDDKPLSQIDRFVIAEIANLKASQSSQATANRYLALIRAILRRAAFEWEWIQRPPRIHLFKESSRRIRWLTGEQVQTLLNELHEHQRDACLFALATGLRHGNLVAMRWDQIDMERRTAWFFADQVKNGEELHVSLNDTAMDVLHRRTGLHSDYVFTYRNRPIKRFNTRSWYRAMSRAQISNFRWHDLRHTWASWLVQVGVPLYSVQEMGGWKTAKMVRRYAHLSPSVNLENARKIDDVLGKISDVY